MKKTRIFAGLTALLCCFQAGFAMSCPAEALTVVEMTTENESETYVIEEESESTGLSAEEMDAYYQVYGAIKDFISNNQLTKCGLFDDSAYLTIEVSVSYYPAGCFGETEESIAEAKNQLEQVRTFCEEQGFTEQYQIRFNAYQYEIAVEIPEGETQETTELTDEASENSEMQAVCEEIRSFIKTNQLKGCNAVVYDSVIHVESCRTFGWSEEQGYYVLTDVSVATEEEAQAQLDQIKAFCEEQGYTENYPFDFFTSEIAMEGEAGSAQEENGTQPSSEIVTEFKAGDVNLDHTINVLDVITINRAILGKDILTGMQNQTADMNQDGSIDSSDSLAILKYIVGIAETSEEKEAILKAVNLGASVQSETVEGKQLDQNFITAQTGFYLDILKHAEKTSPEENVLVSPYSVMQALAMTANGADSQTRSEMESALGGIALDDLNQYLYTQRVNQPNNEKCKLSTANSIWYRQDGNNLNISQNFLQTNANYYAADAFPAPFDDSTVKDINTWVDQKTDHMINKLIDNIADDVMLYLINAVAFDGKWIDQYDIFSVHEKEFTALDGSAQTVDMMYSDDENYYLEDENATGFYKYYQGGRYAFAALLPNEGVSVDDYVSGLTADSLHQTLANPERIETHTAIPKFSYDYDILLNDTLQDMGMQTAFEPHYADFSDMAALPDGRNLYIGRVLHKTHIEMTEAGTKAAAVTAVEVCAESAIEVPPQYKTVYLDRPFVYMIVDTENYLPVFMGTVKSIEK